MILRAATRRSFDTIFSQLISKKFPHDERRREFYIAANLNALLGRVSVIY